MLIDWLTYGVLVWGTVSILNATAFKTQPASRAAAWTLTVLAFVVNLIAMSVLKYLRYQVISQDLGFELKPKGPVDGAGALMFSWLFFALLRKAPKAPAPHGEAHQAPAQIPPQSLPQAARPQTQQVGLQPETVPTRPDAERQIALQAKANVPSPVAAVESADDEQVWALALAEFDGPSRRAGLWAKCFAQSEGDESRAKAMYLRERAAEFMSQPVLHAVAPVSAFPSTLQPKVVEQVPEPVPSEEELSPSQCTATLVAVGCRVSRPTEGVWEVLHPSGTTTFARSPEALQAIASRYGSRNDGAL